jgi:4-amino-4-deoxy-L-arabinose transferase-like glycosyltransferase
MSIIARPTFGSDDAVAAGRAEPSERLAGLLSAGSWPRLALIGVAGLAAILYLVGLTISGYANTYYSMAAQAASQSWSAWFFGSLDASNFITVDKPPLATMVMGLSVRLFGLSSWSILLPEASMGVASVVVLFLAVRRSFGPVAATVAGVVMALTPAAVLIFRYDNPDALLTLLLVSAAWALLRSLDAGRMRWLVLASTLVGLGFMTKYLQAWVILPVFALVWIVAAPGGGRRRIAGLAVSAATALGVSLAWPLAVQLIPATARPYVGGSTGNSVFDLILGYDGLGRILGGDGNPNGGVGGGGFGGAAGILRMFNGEFGGQVSWLIPYSLIALVSGLILRARRSRTDRALAGYLLWGGWLVVTGLVFSLMSGIIHSYYSVVLAPAIGALVGGGTVELWRLRRRSPLGGLVLAGALLVSGAWAWMLLDRTPDFWPGLGIAVFAVTLVAAVIVALPAGTWRRLSVVAMTVGLAALLVGPAVYAGQTISTAHSGGDPAAGPATATGGPGRGFAGNRGTPPDASGGTDAGLPGAAGGALPPSSGTGAVGPVGGAVGGPDGGVDQALSTYLARNAGSARWIVAVSGSGTAAEIQLETGLPVMTMGGFNGSDATPTLAQLQAYVASGELRYVLLSQVGGGGPGGGSVTSERDAWVTSACTVVDTGSTNGTLYDCSTAMTG